MEEGTRIIHLGKKNSLKDVEVLGANPISFEKAFGEFKSNATGAINNPVNRRAAQAKSNSSVINEKPWVAPQAEQKRIALKNSIDLANKSKALVSKAKTFKSDAQFKAIKPTVEAHKSATANHIANIAKIGLKVGFDGYSNAAGDSTSNQYGNTVENSDGSYTTTPTDGSSPYDSNSDGSPLSSAPQNVSTIKDANGNTTFADYNSDINKSTATVNAQANVNSIQSKIDALNAEVTNLGINNFDLGKDTLFNDHQHRINENNKKIDNDNTSLTIYYSDLNTANLTLLASIEQDYTNWKTAQDISDLQNQINTLNDDVQTAQASADQAETDAQTAQSAADSLQAAVNASTQAATATTTPSAIDPNTGLPVSNVAPAQPIATTPTAQIPGQSVDTLTGLPTADANAIESGSLESTNQQYPASYGQQPLTYGQAPAQPIYVNQGGGSQDQGMGDGSNNYDYDNEDFDTSDINPDDSSFDGTGKYIPGLPYAPEDFSGFTEEQLNKTFKSEEGIEVPITIKVSQLIAEIGIVKSALLKAMWELKWATTENQVSEEGTIPQLRAKVSALKEKFNYLTNILETYKRSRTAKGTPDANRLLEVTEAQKNVLAIANANRAAREAKQAKINSGKASSSQVAPIAAEIPVGGDLVKTTVVNVVSETAPTGNNGSSTNRVVELYSNADGSGDKPNSSINWKVVSLTAVGALVLVFAYNKLKK